MSSYDMSSYNLPQDDNSQLKGINYMQLDMKNSMLQNRLTRNEKLLEEYERKNAVHSRSLKLLSKYINALSNGAKRFMQKSLKVELSNLMQMCNGASDITDLVETLTDFIGSIKIMRSVDDGKNEEHKQRAKSTGYDKHTGNAAKELQEENLRLKGKLEKINKGQLECYNCHTSLDIRKILQLAKPATMHSHVFSNIERQEAYDSMMQSKTLDISKFSELRSLHSFLKDDKCDKPSKIMGRHNFTQNQKDSMCIDDSSMFFKKKNPASQNISAMPMLSINDTFEEIRPEKNKSHVNWVIKEMEDSEKTETDYSIESRVDIEEAIEQLEPKNLLSDFNKVADSFDQSFNLNRNPKSEDKVQLRNIQSFSVDSLPDVEEKYKTEMQVRLRSIDLSADQNQEESQLIDKTLNSRDSSDFLTRNHASKKLSSNDCFGKSQETLKVEAVYAFRQQKGKPSPNPTSVEEISFDEVKITKRLPLRNTNEGFFKSMKGDGPVKAPLTGRNLHQKGLFNSKSGNNISAKTKLGANTEREEQPVGRNTTTGFFKGLPAAEDKQRLSTRPSTKPQTTTTRTLCSTEKTLNSIFSNNVGKHQKAKSKLAN